MPLKQIKWLLALMALASLLSGCGMHYTVKGKVLDSNTRQPVEGALVAIKWERNKLSPPGLPVNTVKYGTSESLTDAQGQFSIPKYLIGHYYMAVYKQGYVCWNNEILFNPKGKNNDEMYLHREENNVSNNMTIELVAIENDTFPVREHANFVNIVTQVDGTMFSEATIHEVNIDRNAYRQLIKQKKRDKK